MLHVKSWSTTVRQGRMIKASSSLQDLRSGLYGKRKAEGPWRHAKASDGSGGVVDSGSGRPDSGAGSTAVFESGSDRIGLINLVAKCAGARSAGNPHAACDVAGAGNGATDTAKRARRGKPWIRPSRRPDGPPRQFSTLPGNGATDTAKRARRGKPRIQPSQVLMGHRSSSRPYGLLPPAK